MQTLGGGTVVHTSIKPEEQPHTSDKRKVRPEIKKAKPRKRVGFSERLLRNTAIACTMLLGVLTLKNVDAPWSQAAVSGIEAALTMRIDPDSSLGELSFVRSFLPESTLVFFDMSSSGPLEPVEGTVVHKFMEGQPWTLYSADTGSAVRSALSGTVSGVSQIESGDWCVLIDHGGGTETMYAYLDKPQVGAGDKVARGEEIGKLCGDRLYYEYRYNGSSVSPTEAHGR